MFSTPPAVERARVVRPAAANAAQPRAVTDLASAVSQTAALVEGSVREIHYEFSEEDGPWTRVVLDNVTRHFGAADKSGTVELRQFGGLLPNGRMMIAAELPVFVQGQRYLVFLRNTAWNVSPVVGNLALRIGSIDGIEVLVSADGQPVLNVDQSGARFGAPLFDPVHYTGPAIVRKQDALPQLASKPLDRRAFLDALRVELDRQTLKIEGQFFEYPAGNFRWRGQALVPHGQPLPAAGAGRAELDTSGPAR
jgi:hypothetical protein